MVLLVAYAFYYRNVFSPTIYHHMPRERRCLRHSGAQQSHLPAEFLSNRRHRHRGMAASSPLHRDASASRQPSSHSLHGITASNAALPSRKVEGLLGPLRPWSGSRSCGAPPRPLPLPFAHALRADTRTLTAARARAVRVQPCHRILEATTMRRTAGIENKMRTRVERREKGSDRLPPYGVRSVRRPIGNGVMIIYDLTPAEWASGSVTMRFLVRNYP